MQFLFIDNPIHLYFNKELKLAVQEGRFPDHHYILCELYFHSSAVQCEDLSVSAPEKLCEQFYLKTVKRGRGLQASLKK